jgi:hypothetical protein
MTPITNPLQRLTSCQSLYNYVNTTSSLQVIQIVNISEWHFERVVFPGHRLLFYAPPNADLEVKTSYCSQAILVKKIPGVQLEVKQ